MRLDELDFRVINDRPEGTIEECHVYPKAGMLRVLRWRPGCTRDDGSYDLILYASVSKEQRLAEHVNLDALTAQCLLYELLKR